MTHYRVLYMPLLLLIACGGPGQTAQDAASYADVLARAGQDPESELDRCAALHDEATRGDCAAVVAVAAYKRYGGSDWCARVPEGKWRDECTFQTAEAALTASGERAGAAEAIARCQQAGGYEADCVVHVWRPQLGAVMDGMRADEFASRYDKADALYVQTVAQLQGRLDIESMYWLSFFGTGFHNSGAVDAARCAGLSVEGQRRCEDAAALLATESLEERLRQRGLLDAFCALSPPRSQDVAALLGVAPSEALDRALVAQQPMLCGGGAGPALSGGLRTRPMGGP